ncbi:MAG: (Fe-S)-binding protein [Gammaproteobacteria bacterium]|nr:(Fe-S)-binding protein [Gammaproteobacteria bacterium]
MQPDIATLRQNLAYQTDLCVKCGMCSSQCPTYLLSRNENESPRGRIALIQALISEQSKNTDLIQKHLDSCLSCLHCEKICPSKVPYSEILAGAQTLLSAQSTVADKKIKKISTLKYSQWKKLALLYRLTYSSGLLKLAANIFFRKFRYYLQVPAKPAAFNVDSKQRVQLFSGCLAKVFDQSTQQGAIKLLQACNVSLDIPENQQCCGALASHNKQFSIADECIKNNSALFKKNVPTIFTTSGCGAFLKKQNAKSDLDSQQQYIEAGRFLLDNTAFQQLQFGKLEKTVLIHSPCSEKNDLKQSSSLELIQKIPDIQIKTMPDITPCCGAGGAFMIKHTEAAQQIRFYTEKEILNIKPQIIVSTNYPCAMHIAAGLKEKGLDIEVMHPLSLLARQLMTR